MSPGKLIRLMFKRETVSVMHCHHSKGSQSLSTFIQNELERLQECCERFPTAAFCYVLSIHLQKDTELQTHILG